jgi:hypothetical protein
MGIRQWARDHAMKDPVAGVLKLTAVDVGGGAVTLTGVVTAPQIEPTPVQHKVDAPRAKLAALYRRLDLPVLVDRTDPRRLRIQWDAVPDRKQLEMMDAARLAERMSRTEGAGGGPFEVIDPGGPAQGVFDNVRIVTPAELAADGDMADLMDMARRMAQEVGDALRTGIVTGMTGDPNAGQTGATWSVHVSTDPPHIAEGGSGAVRQQPVYGGEQATATVLAVQDVQTSLQGAMPGQGVSVIDLTLEVTRQLRDSYTTTLRVGFATAERRNRVARIGASLPVLVDPADPARVAIDTARL